MTDEQLDALVREHGTAEAARRAGMGRSKVWHRVRRHRKRTGCHPPPTACGPVKPPPPEKAAGCDDETKADGSRVVTLRSALPMTIDEAIAARGIDRALWRVKASRVTTFPGYSANADKTGFNVVELCSIRLELEPVGGRASALADLLARIEAASPVVPAIARPKVEASDPLLFVPMPTDLHLGKRMFAGADHQDWSTADACRTAHEMLERAIDWAERTGPVAEVLLPWGGDLMSADNVYRTTTAGTPQPDFDCWDRVHQSAEALSVAFVDRLKEVAPVRVVIVRGNHDWHSAYTVGRFLAAYYRGDANVTVDAGPEPTKFHAWGRSLIGLDHGKQIKPDDLSRIILNEAARRRMGEVRSHWLLGDKHRAASFDKNGVNFHYCQTLTPPDAWHRLNGFVDAGRGLDSFCFGRETGRRYHDSNPVIG